MVKNREINGTEEIGLVTPTPDDVIQNVRRNIEKYNGTSSVNSLQFSPSQLITGFLISGIYQVITLSNVIYNSPRSFQLCSIRECRDICKRNLLQEATSRFDDVIVAAGSGGTIEGLSIGNHLSGAGLK